MLSPELLNELIVLTALLRATGSWVLSRLGRDWLGASEEINFQIALNYATSCVKQKLKWGCSHMTFKYS